MNLKQRLEKLEDADPNRDDRPVLCWRSAVSRMGDVLSESVHSASILGSSTAPGETHVRGHGESQEIFVRNVIDRACVVHGRHDEEFRDRLRWHPSPDAQVVT